MATINARFEVVRKFNRVFLDILPNFLVSFIWHMESAIDEKIIGTIISCNEFKNNCPIM